MSSTPIAVGILGAGNISDTHARAAAAIPGVRVVAVYGQNASRAARLAEQHGAVAFDTLEGFLAHRPMDIVAIGSPSSLHAEQGMAAARQGLHVLVEKPLDVTTARSDELIDAARRAGVKLGVFFQDRLKPDVVRMKSIVERGLLGTPVLASGRVKWYRPPDYYADSKWRGKRALDGGGAVINQAIHTLDLMLHLFGPIATVEAQAATRLHAIEVEDTAVALLRFASGALGVFEATTSVYPGYPRRLELTGARGTLILEHDSLVAIDLVQDAAAELARDPLAAAVSAPAGGAQNAASPTVSDATPHRRILEDFITAIRSGGTPACDGLEGRRSVEAVEAIYASAREGRPVTIDSGR
ncbi:MAG TPA: Gfo/Idh/MocA family oxidoreductase [Vicinamibacterales bacterium]|nr:Gfo/Idh/MocA family oxidoreductase [Vicinamibacterales bacterium]